MDFGAHVMSLLDDTLGSSYDSMVKTMESQGNSLSVNMVAVFSGFFSPSFMGAGNWSRGQGFFCCVLANGKLLISYFTLLKTGTVYLAILQYHATENKETTALAILLP